MPHYESVCALANRSFWVNFFIWYMKLAAFNITLKLKKDLWFYSLLAWMCRLFWMDVSNTGSETCIHWKSAWTLYLSFIKCNFMENWAAQRDLEQPLKSICLQNKCVYIDRKWLSKFRMLCINCSHIRKTVWLSCFKHAV